MSEIHDFNALIAELEKNIVLLDDLAHENSRAAGRIEAGAVDILDYAALGYTIHNVYCLVENYFLRIAKFFENNLDSESWHKDLVRRMTLEIEGLRPAFMGDNLAEKMDELRAFRHVFRNLYQSPLKQERVRMVQELVPSTIEGFKDAHRVFIGKLEHIKQALNPL